jgi:hypothetical protein
MGWKKLSDFNINTPTPDASDEEYSGGSIKPITYSRSGTPIYDPIALEQAKQSARTNFEGMIAASKERETAISKAGRLEIVGNRIKDEWLKTSPYKGFITKTGLVPVLGAWDIVKKGIGATDAQRQDQAYADFIQGVRAQLARGMGDVGNLSEYEQKAVVRLVPNLMDSYELGMEKIGKLARLVDDIRSTRGGGKNPMYQEFDINGVNYRIPKDKVESFKKSKGIK